MSNDSIRIGEAALSLAATYWLHSTVLLSGVWLWLRLQPSASYLLQERLWKFAATAGLATAALQSATGTGIPLLGGPRGNSTIKSTPQATFEEPANGEARADHSLSVQESLLLVRESLDGLQIPNRETSARSAARSPVPTPINATAFQQQSTSVFDRSVSPVAQPDPLPDAIAASDSSRSPKWNFSEPAPESASWQARAAATLAIACGLGLLWFIGEWLLFLMATRRLQPASWKQLKQLDDLRQRFGVYRRIELLTSEKFSEPVAFGIWQWKIILPTNLDSRLSAAELDSLLAHEIAHLARGDVLWLHVGRLLTSVFAWQPLNFLARRQWQLQAEFASDDWAISRNVDPVSLARCLTIVAEWRSERRLGAVALPAGGSRSHITDRVERLLAPIGCDIWLSRPRRLLLLGGLAVVGGLLAAAGPSVRHADASVANQSPSTDFSRGLSKSQSASSPDRSTTQRRYGSQAFPAELRSETAAELRHELGDEAAQLALEATLLTNELAELDDLLASRPNDPRLQKTIDGLRSRLAALKRRQTTRSSTD